MITLKRLAIAFGPLAFLRSVDVEEPDGVIEGITVNHRLGIDSIPLFAMAGSMRPSSTAIRYDILMACHSPRT
jgi:hypothetical protein